MRLALLSKVEDAHEDAVWTAAWSGPEQLLTGNRADGIHAYDLHGLPGRHVPSDIGLCVPGSVDENVKVWTEGADALESLHTYTGHTLGVISVVVDPSGTYAASSALDSFIRVWNLHDTSTKAVIETQPSETWSVTFAQQPGAEGPLLLAAAGAGVERPPLRECFLASSGLANVYACGRRISVDPITTTVSIYSVCNGPQAAAPTRSSSGMWTPRWSSRRCRCQRCEQLTRRPVHSRHPALSEQQHW